MTSSQFFILLAAIYLAPQANKSVANAVGLTFVVISIVWRG